MFLALVAAVCAFVAVAGVVAVVLRGSGASLAERRMERIGLHPQEDWLKGSELLRRERSAVPVLQLFLDSTGFSDRALSQLERAGIRLKVGEYFLLRLTVAFLVAVLMLLLLPVTAIGIAAIVIAAAAGYMLPALYVYYAKERRLRVVTGQLAETLLLISNALRSGFAFAQAVELATEQMPPPISDDLRALLRDLGLGARMDDALRSMADRTGSLDMELVVTTIIVQRTTGGNLSEVLDNVAETITERDRLQGQIRALTAQQRLTGTVLSIYPLALGALLTLISPTTMKYLWQEEFGRILLATAVVLQILGAFTIQRILRIEI